MQFSILQLNTVDYLGYVPIKC